MPRYLLPKAQIEIPRPPPIHLKPTVPVPTITKPVQIRRPLQHPEVKHEDGTPMEKVKRGRGRPRKYPAPPVRGQHSISSTVVVRILHEI